MTIIKASVDKIARRLHNNNKKIQLHSALMHRWQKFQNDIVTELNSHRKRVKNDVCGNAEARGNTFARQYKKHFSFLNSKLPFWS